MSEQANTDNFDQQIKHIKPEDRNILMRYYKTIKDLPRFNEKENQTYIELYKLEADSIIKKHLKNKIVESNLYMVLTLLIKYFYYETSSKFSLDDMIQLTNLTLIKRIDDYDVKKGKFHHFVSYCLYNDLYYCDNYSTSPFELPENKYRLARAFSLLAKGCSDDEIIRETKMSKKTLRGIKFIQQGQVLLGNPVLPEENIDITDIENQLYNESLVAKIFPRLTFREKDILRRIYFESDETKTCIAVSDDLGISDQAVCSVKNKAFLKAYRACQSDIKE